MHMHRSLKGSWALAAGLNRRYHEGGEIVMSEYRFHCEDCDKEFAKSLHMSERDHDAVVCPHCGSRRVQQLVTSFSAVTPKKS